MSRHRQIDVRMWGDAKFRSLSKPQPNGQTLWIYLLTGPHTTSIPGIFHVGEAALAEALGWELEAFREAFREALTKGMLEADFEARVLWIPNAIFYNPPQSKNVVKSWRAYWDEIPECKLKVKAYQHLKGFLEGFGEGFSSVFQQVCANPSLIQEQEQEQEQDSISVASPPQQRTKKTRMQKPKTKEGRKKRAPDPLWDAVAEVTNSDPKASASYIGKVVSSLRNADPPYKPEEVRKLPDILQSKGITPPYTLGTIEKYIGWTRQQPTNGQPQEAIEEKLRRQREQRQRATGKTTTVPISEVLKDRKL